MASLTQYFGTTGKVINTAAYRRAIKQALDASAREAVKQFKRTTKTWEGQPDFTIARDGEFGRIVGTENEIYDYVTHGTRPHIIRPVAAQNLAFQTVHVARTVPNALDSRGGGSSGPVAFAVEVKHPGTKPRNFEKLVADEVQSRMEGLFTKNFQEAQR